MALIRWVGFNGIDSTTLEERLRVVGVAPTIELGAFGRDGALGVKMGASGGIEQDIAWAAANELWLSFSYKPVSAHEPDGANPTVCYLADDNGTDVVFVVWVVAAESFRIIGGAPEYITLYQSADGSAPAGSWRWLDVRAKASSAGAGDVELWVDGVQLYNSSSVTTASPGATFYRRCTVGGWSTGEAYTDAVLICDLTGAAPYNGRLGPCQIAGPLEQFSPAWYRVLYEELGDGVACYRPADAPDYGGGMLKSCGCCPPDAELYLLPGEEVLFDDVLNDTDFKLIDHPVLSGRKTVICDKRGLCGGRKPFVCRTHPVHFVTGTLVFQESWCRLKATAFIGWHKEAVDRIRATVYRYGLESVVLGYGRSIKTKFDTWYTENSR